MAIAKPPDQTSTTLACPKCGFAQEGGTECMRCGIVFAKYKPPAMTAEVDVTEHDPTLPPPSTAKPAKPSLLSRLLRILPWISLAVTATVLFLILKQTPPLTIQSDPEAANRATDKMAQLQLAMQSNQRHTTTMDEAELNQWMRENLAIASAHEAQQAGIDIPAGQQTTVKDVQSALKDVRINLIGNQLRAYALFVMYGKDVSLQLDGTLETQAGYIRLKPTGGKIGSLPLPSSSLDRVVHQLFDSPHNRENFQLPPQIESVRVEQNSLVITTR